jgi:hypothetical protein
MRLWCRVRGSPLVLRTDQPQQHHLWLGGFVYTNIARNMAMAGNLSAPIGVLSVLMWQPKLGRAPWQLALTR